MAIGNGQQAREGVLGEGNGQGRWAKEMGEGDGQGWYVCFLLVVVNSMS